MPEPDPNHKVSRENLTQLLDDLDALRGLVGEIGSSTIPLALAVAKAKIRILTTKGRIHRMIDAAADNIPAPAEALACLAAARGGPHPWLSPTVLETPIGVPEVIGPAVYVPEAAMPSAEEDPIDLPEFQRRGATEAFRTHLLSIAAEETGRLSK